MWNNLNWFFSMPRTPLSIAEKQNKWNTTQRSSRNDQWGRGQPGRLNRVSNECHSARQKEQQRRDHWKRTRPGGKKNWMQSPGTGAKEKNNRPAAGQITMISEAKERWSRGDLFPLPRPIAATGPFLWQTKRWKNRRQPRRKREKQQQQQQRQFKTTGAAINIVIALIRVIIIDPALRTLFGWCWYFFAGGGRSFFFVVVPLRFTGIIFRILFRYRSRRHPVGALCWFPFSLASFNPTAHQPVGGTRQKDKKNEKIYTMEKRERDRKKTIK